MEIDQICHRRDGAAWPCGREAAAALANFLEVRTVNCDVWQKKTPGDATRDACGRFISIC